MRFLSAVNPLVWALLIGAVLALTLILYFSSFARALAPKRGTLEWIAMYDRPGLCLSGSGGAFRWKELPLCLLAAVLSAGLYLLAVCLQLRSFILFSVPMGRLMLFGGAGLFALSAAGCFALTRSLYGSLPAAFCCAMLLGLEYAAEYVAVLALVWLLFFFHRWMRADFDAPAAHSFGYLAAAEACAVLGVCLVPALIFPVGVLGILLLVTVALRFHGTHREDRLRQSVLTLVFALLCFYLMLLIARLFRELTDSGQFSFLLDGGFYLRALTCWCRTDGLLRPLSGVFSGTVNQLLLWGGLLGAVFSVFGAWRYGHAEGLLLGVAALGVLLMWLLTGVYALAAALVPALGYVFVHFARRGRRGFAIGGAAGCFVVSLIYDLVLLGVL